MNIIGAIVCFCLAIFAAIRMQKHGGIGYAIAIVAFAFAATGFLFNEFMP